MIQKAELADVADLIKEALDCGKDVIITVRGISMMPLLRNGKDSVLLRKKDNYAVNDIVFYRRDNGKFVLHRIVGKKNNLFSLCGDNQIFVEHGIRLEQIWGYVRTYTKNGKTKTTDDFSYRLYTFWHRFTFPVRKLMRLVGILLKKCLKL